jgi:hypothetical protein
MNKQFAGLSHCHATDVLGARKLMLRTDEVSRPVFAIADGRTEAFRQSEINATGIFTGIKRHAWH